MKRTLIIGLCLLGMSLTVFFSPAGVYAYTIDLYPHEEGLSGSAWAKITGDQTNTITFQLGLGDGIEADIRAFYFDLETAGIDSSNLIITVDSLNDLNGDYSGNDVITYWPTPSNSADMNGAVKNGDEFQFGVEFGEQGIGKNKGDISSVTFSIKGLDDTTILSLGDNFGMRLMSFGEGGDSREGSRKMLGEHEDVPVNPVPEPTTMLLLCIGLLGLTGMGRKLKTAKAHI